MLPRCRTRRPTRSRTPRGPSALLPPLRARLLRVQLVRLYDPLHELVPHDVLVPEADEGDAVDRAEDVLHVDEPGRLLPRQVDLGVVAGDDDLRPEAEAGEEHLHLLGTRVLRLVEDDERVVERATAHEGERRDLHDPALHVRVQPVRLEHVVQGVVEWAEVRIDLREHVPRQEAEALAGLHGRPREDDPVHLALLERGDGEGHREVGLPRAGRADRERHGVAPDRLDVALLHHGLRRDRLAAVAPDDVLEDVTHVLALVDRAEHRVYGGRADLMAALHELDHLVDHGAYLVDAFLVAFDRQLVSAEVDGDAKPLTQVVEDAVTDRGKLGGNVVGHRHRFLHCPQCRFDACPTRSSAVTRSRPRSPTSSRRRSGISASWTNRWCCRRTNEASAAASRRTATARWWRSPSSSDAAAAPPAPPARGSSTSSPAGGPPRGPGRAGGRPCP